MSIRIKNMVSFSLKISNILNTVWCKLYSAIYRNCITTTWVTIPKFGLQRRIPYITQTIKKPILVILDNANTGKRFIQHVLHEKGNAFNESELHKSYFINNLNFFVHVSLNTDTIYYMLINICYMHKHWIYRFSNKHNKII